MNITNIKTILILIIDDDPVFRNLLDKELKRNFFKTITVPDGKSALEIIEKEDIDIVLLDIKLPDMDGIDILSKIKESRNKSEVIVITGYGTQDLAIQSIRKGAIDYIEKPIDINNLTTALGRAQENLAIRNKLNYKNTILVIDDEKNTAKHLKKCLEKEGYEVFTAFNGKEGLAIIEKNKIDVIVTDINMQDINGIEVLQKAKKEYPDIEGIMVTGFRDQEWAIKSLRAGAIDYINKPIEIDELIISIEKAIRMINLNRNLLYRDRERKIFSEITAKELSQTQAQLFQTSKLATLGEMSAGLAHEMNQPLSGISLIARNLRKLSEKQKLSPEELDNGLKDIDGMIKRMSKIIQHIRTFARQDTLKFIEVDINNTLDSAINLLSEQLRLHEIKVIKEYTDNLPKIEGEPYQLEQVWINLISNARDALDEKSQQMENNILDEENFKKTITLATSYNKKNKTITVSVKDNGIGIDNSKITRVFEPFFTTKEVGKASGLGLSISYGIIENHKGKIMFKSSKNKKTEIIVILNTEIINVDNSDN